MGYIYVYMLLKGYFSKWPPGGATGALWGARGAFCGLPAPHMGCIYVYMLLKGYFSKWPPGGATGALGGLEAPVGSQYLIWGISMYIYYVYPPRASIFVLICVFIIAPLESESPDFYYILNTEFCFYILLYSTRIV